MKRVAICALAVFVAVQAFTEEQQKRMKEINDECIKESNVDKKVLGDAVGKVYVKDPKLVAHAYCFSKKANIQNAEGEVQVDALKAKLAPQMKDDSKVEELVKKCVIVE
ncbi:PBP GOBP domain containing protein, partial [Asbolus verrucosus]